MNLAPALVDDDEPTTRRTLVCKSRAEISRNQDIDFGFSLPDGRLVEVAGFLCLYF